MIKNEREIRDRIETIEIIREPFRVLQMVNLNFLCLRFDLPLIVLFFLIEKMFNLIESYQSQLT